MTKNFSKVPFSSAFLANIVSYFDEDGELKIIVERSTDVEFSKDGKATIWAGSSIMNVVNKLNVFSISPMLCLIDETGIHLASPFEADVIDSKPEAEKGAATGAPILNMCGYTVECELIDYDKWGTITARAVNTVVDHLFLNNDGTIDTELLFSCKTTVTFSNF